jgi:hypothetical protein
MKDVEEFHLPKRWAHHGFWKVDSPEYAMRSKLPIISFLCIDPFAGKQARKSSKLHRNNERLK